jgi:hypothetical protein
MCHATNLLHSKALIQKLGNWKWFRLWNLLSRVARIAEHGTIPHRRWSRLTNGLETWADLGGQDTISSDAATSGPLHVLRDECADWTLNEDWLLYTLGAEEFPGGKERHRMYTGN